MEIVASSENINGDFEWSGGAERSSFDFDSIFYLHGAWHFMPFQFNDQAKGNQIDDFTFHPVANPGFCGYISIMLITSSHQTPNGDGASRIYVCKSNPNLSHSTSDCLFGALSLSYCGLAANLWACSEPIP